MQVFGLTMSFAPLATGHPHGLPGAKPEKPQTQKIRPIGAARDADAALTEGQSPDKFWRAFSGEPIVEDQIAPPSIMQIKITQMLDDQVEDLPLYETKEDTDEPRLPDPMSLTGPDDDAEADAPLVTRLIPAQPAPPILPAYEETSNLARNSVFSTLP